MKKWMLRPGLWATLWVLVLGLVIGIMTDGTPNVGLCLSDEEDTARLTEALSLGGMDAYPVWSDELRQAAALVIGDWDGAADDRFGAVPAVYVDLKPTDGCYIGGDAAQAGKLQAEMLLGESCRGDWNEDGIVTCCFLGGALSREDMQAWKAAIGQTLEDAGVEMELVDMEAAVFSRAAGKEAAGAVLSGYGKDLEVIFAYSDPLTLGAMDAISDVGRSVGGDISLLGAGRSSIVAELAQQGKLTGYAGLDEGAFTLALQTELTRIAGGDAPRSCLLTYTAFSAQ